METILSFLRDLEANNNKPWFDAHKNEYQEARAHFNTIVERGYNVRKTEEYIKALNDKDKNKVKAVSASVRLGINTIKQSYDLCRKTGLDADYQVTEYEDEVKVTIRFKKQG